MRYYEVCPLQVIRPDSAVFTYSFDSSIKLGQFVLVEVGKKKLIGIVMKEVHKPTYVTKQITELLDLPPLPPQLLRLASWLSDYYVTHMAIVFQTLLPRGLQKNRRERHTVTRSPLRERTKIVFNKTQLRALEEIDQAPPGTILLHGITGSGKTAVYIETAKKTLEMGRSVIILVPEISLTPQVVDEFEAHFDNIVLTHSKQTEAERHIAWLKVLKSEQPQVVIGPRSALFMPLKDIGLIVIDEAHEPSFKQEQSPRYSALRAAGVLAKEHKAKLILGSATPLVTDYYVATQSSRPIIEMSSTARQSTAPTVHVVDMKNREHFTRHRFLSDNLLQKLEDTFSAGKQALIFHNRRGSASITLCENCGWQATCARCFLPMTLHADKHELQCHVCGAKEKVSTSCPSCNNAQIIHKGIGTKLIESELTKIFPKVNIGRFDGDTDDDRTIESQYKHLYDGTIDLIIGTQVVAKGLDLPNLRVVGIVQADAGLSLPDYGAAERTFQLLAQAVGRVGRSEHKTSVILQSYQPTHPSVADGITQNYAEFYEKTLAERRRANYPPYTFLLKLVCVYKTEAAAIRNSSQLKRILRQKMPNTVEILGPTPAFYERQRDTYRWQLVLKSKKRSDLENAIKLLPPSHWQFEIDPTSLL